MTHPAAVAAAAMAKALKLRSDGAYLFHAKPYITLPPYIDADVSKRLIHRRLRCERQKGEDLWNSKKKVNRSLFCLCSSCLCILSSAVGR